MKKLIIAILLLSGCSHDASYNVHKFTFEGHQYIEFYNFHTLYGGIGGVVHDPECECMIDYD